MFSPVNVTGWKKAGAALCLYRSGCGGKHRGFPETGPARQQMGSGDGPLLARLQREYPEVHFAGVFPQPELARFYRAADVFVFPSLTDTFGLVCWKPWPAARR
jgi:hypothetical protein